MISRKGNTIIEVLVAATLISLAVLASLALASRSQRQTDFSQSMNTATYYNSQAVDWLRNMRTSLGWATFIDELNSDAIGNTVIYCVNSLPTLEQDFINLVYAASCGSSYLDTDYQREMTITLSSDESLIFIVTTYWNNRERSIATEATLTKW